MNFKTNPYYHPENCGLGIFESIDTAGSWEYDIFCIWEKLDDKTLWWDTDSGCSCPIPFDNSDNGHDLKPITKDAFFNFEQGLENHPNITNSDIFNIK